MRLLRLFHLRLLIFSAFAGLIGTGVMSQERAWKSVILAEFFTSQGCNTCPPADDFLLDLDKEKAVLPIAYHVDYWDHLGWVDTFGDREYSNRQRDYARGKNSTRYYTPQVIIDGSYHLVGSHRNKVWTILNKLGHQPSATPEINLNQDILTIRWNARPAEFDRVYYVLFDPKVHNVQINAGENRGTVIPYGNVVTEMFELPVPRTRQNRELRWSNKELAELKCPKDLNVALIFQQTNGKYPTMVTDTFYTSC